MADGTRVVWDAEHGWHETDEAWTLALRDNGSIRWVRAEA